MSMSSETKMVFGGLSFASILWGIQGILKETQFGVVFQYTSPEVLGPTIKYALLLLFGIILFLTIGITHIMNKLDEVV